MKELAGRFETPQASRYLQQLCKHFGHKVEVSSDDAAGTIAFPTARARLAATPSTLDVVLEGESDEDLARVRGAIDSHLKRFAFREGFERMDWGTPSERVA